ncbi:MAG: polyprenol monophosphomannose synthase [Thaumarchaeota archaeon]|nr:polyprenol monophosphomannose synthase [Nitrososphaerota archaeon]
MTSVVVVIPTYNEKENIVDLIPKVRSVLSDAGYENHVLIVDDSSPDGTGEAVHELSRTDSSIHLLTRSEKKGLGSAYLDGFKYALQSKPDILVQMDADFSHPPESLPTLIKAVHDEADVAIGSRYVEGGGTEGWSKYRQLVSSVANVLVHLILGLKTKDTTTGFRALRRSVADALQNYRLSSSGYDYQVETLYFYLKQGFKVREVPFTYRRRISGETKLSVGEIFHFTWTLLRLRLKGLRSSGP